NGLRQRVRECGDGSFVHSERDSREHISHDHSFHSLDFGELGWRQGHRRPAVETLRFGDVEQYLAHRRAGRAENHGPRRPERSVEQYDLLPNDSPLDDRRTGDVLRELPDHAFANGAVIGSGRAYVAALSLTFPGLVSSEVQAQTRASQPGTASTVSLAMANAGTADSARDIE